MTDSEKHQAAHDQAQTDLAAAIAALPPLAQEFVRRWRRAVELLGRAHDGNGVARMTEFVEDVRLLATPPTAAEDKVDGTKTTGSGV